MKKYIFYLLLFFLSITALNAEDNSGISNKTHGFIGFNFERQILNFKTINMFGVNIEAFISNNISVFYNFQIGFEGSDMYLHSSAGFVGGIYAISNNWFASDNYDDEEDTDFYRYTALILAFIPEGIGYHFPMSPQAELIPYINPLGYDYFSETKSFTSGLGVRLNYVPFGNLQISPYAGIRYFYYTGQKSFNLGINAGFRL
ncbi:MAG: hypothetical protein WCT77_10360 [Bacteroidota bacterium]